MQKMMLACFLSFVALASCGIAAPGYQAGPVYGAPIQIAAPVQKSVNYGAVSNLFPVAIQGGYGANVAPAPPSLLIGSASNPSASASSAASNSGLNAGNYQQLAVPAYLLLASEVVNPTYGTANLASYGSVPY